MVSGGDGGDGDHCCFQLVPLLLQAMVMAVEGKKKKLVVVVVVMMADWFHCCHSLTTPDVPFYYHWAEVMMK